LDGTQPATFGRGREDVYDETYRKALKMDTTAFCSTFDPYSLGIVDTIAQVLLPSIVDSSTHRSVRAELYKLNVCWHLNFSGEKLLNTVNTASSSTPAHQENSRNTSTRHDLHHSLDPWLFACLLSTKVASSRFVTRVERLRTTGVLALRSPTLRPFVGRRSTATVNMRFSRSQVVIASP
jgi:hypothetical protein